jgi:hypothetical protein
MKTARIHARVIVFTFHEDIPTLEQTVHVHGHFAVGAADECARRGRNDGSDINISAANCR